MKVTFCDYASPTLVSGPSVWLERLLPELRRLGVESRVLFIRRASGEAPAINRLRALGFECRNVLHVGDTKDRIRWMLEDTLAVRPDVFIANTVVAAYYAGRWVREMGIPTVGVLHSDSEHYRAIQQEFLLGASEYRLSAVVPVSKKMEDDLRAGSGLTSLIRRIPCGIPIPAETASPPSQALRLVYIGRLEEEQKKISATTRALRRAVREIPGVEAVIYGDGSAREAVQKIIAEAVGLPITYGGRLPPEQVQQVMAAAHGFVLLSDYEGLPVALLEAMACGLVPVCFDIPSGIPEVVRHGVNGLLVRDREEGFVAAVRALKESPRRWQELSATARQTVAEEYALEATARAWQELLASLPVSRERFPARLPSIYRLPPSNPVLQRLDRRKTPSALPGLLEKLLPRLMKPRK